MTSLPAKKTSGPPAGVKAGALFQKVLERGRPPFVLIDFPRYDEEGKPIVQVHLRLLTQREQDNCRANAAKYVADVLSGSREVKWKPDELEDNAIASEIIALACRDPEEPEKTFFTYGVMETRECLTEELAILFAAYNGLREKAYPSFRDMEEADMWAWVRVLEEGAQDIPFSRVSRSRLEAFSAWAAKYLASVIRLDGLTSSSSPPGPSSESPNES